MKTRQCAIVWKTCVPQNRRGNTATVWQFWHLSGRHLCLRIFRRLVCASVGFTACLYNLPLAVVPTQILVLHLTLHASVTYTNKDW